MFIFHPIPFHPILHPISYPKIYPSIYLSIYTSPQTNKKKQINKQIIPFISPLLNLPIILLSPIIPHLLSPKNQQTPHLNFLSLSKQSSLTYLHHPSIHPSIHHPSLIQTKFTHSTTYIHSLTHSLTFHSFTSSTNI